MRVNRIQACAIVAFAAPALGTAAIAQQAGLQIAVVHNGTNDPVSSANVLVENADIGFTRQVQTDSFGHVRLEGLPTGGSYTISVVATEDYSHAAAAPVALRANFVRSVTLVVTEPANIEEINVTVLRSVTGLNTVNAEISASLPSTMLRALPIEGRDVVTSLVRLPNVVPSTGFFPEAPTVSINGANGLFTNYLIDGMDNNENFLGGLKFPVPLGFAKEVTVLANSYSVEFGRTANGIVNYTTPSGSNEFHGEVYSLVRPGRPFDASSPFPRRDLSGNAVGESFERYQAGASVGGPLVRDKTFFYANLEYTKDHNINVVDAPAFDTVANVTGNNEFLLGSLRLDHRINEKWVATLRSSVGLVTIDRPGGALGGGNNVFPSAGSEQDRNSFLIAASISYGGDEWDYDGSVQYSSFRWNYGVPKANPSPQVTARDETGLTIAQVGHPGFVFDEFEQTWQTQHRFQRWFGNHRMTIGADIIRSDFQLLGGGNMNGNFTVELTDAQLQTLNSQNFGLALGAAEILALDPRVLDYSVELQSQSFGRTQTLLAFYAEDEWQISSQLTATLGVRWDYDSLTSQGGAGGDVNNFAPRISLNYRPTQRSAIRFGGGLFYGKLPYAVISDALQRNTKSPAFLDQLNQLQAKGVIPVGLPLGSLVFDGNLSVSPECESTATCLSFDAASDLRNIAILNEARILNPNGYDSPYSLQLSAGYQYQATNALTIGVDLIYSRSHNLPRLRDLNAPAAFSPNLAALTDANIQLLRSQPNNVARQQLAQQLGLVRSVAGTDATRPIAIAQGGARQITVTETEGNSTYRALNLQINKERDDDVYALRLSYTLSKLTNNTDDINFRASDANDFQGDWGVSANDRRHVISVVTQVFPMDGMSVSIAALVQSGQPINFVPDASIFGTQDLNGDGQSFGESFVGNSDRYPGIGRNTGRLPWSTTVDLGLRYALLGFGGALEVSADIFNIFNTNNESGFANAASTSNQIQFGGGAPFVQRNAGAPRQFQFGVAWKF